MAITETIQAKEFTAGAPDITLKGDLRFNRRDEEEFPDTRDNPLNPFDKDLKMASMDENEKEFERLVDDFMERGFSLQEAIEEARETLEKKSMAYGGRAQYGLGSLVKSVKKAVKGAVKGVGSILKSPAGLLALGVGINQFGIPFTGGMGQGFFGNMLNLGSGSKAMDALKVGGAGAIITGLLAEKEQQEGESDVDYAKRQAQVKDQLKVQFSRLYPQGENETPEDYDVRISAMVEGADDQTITPGEFAVGGRVSYSGGTKKTQLELPFGEPDYYIGTGKNRVGIYIQSDGKRYAVPIGPGGLPDYAMGGRVGRAFGSDKLVEQASGIEGIPINVNSKGVKELDMRETGGFIPPVGVKEKADDIPAMLSNNEFVFTADAVRAAGGGSVNKGAQRMYDLMKNLESKVV